MKRFRNCYVLCGVAEKTSNMNILAHSCAFLLRCPFRRLITVRINFHSHISLTFFIFFTSLLLLPYNCFTFFENQFEMYTRALLCCMCLSKGTKKYIFIYWHIVAGCMLLFLIREFIVHSGRCNVRKKVWQYRYKP